MVTIDEQVVMANNPDYPRLEANVLRLRGHDEVHDCRFAGFYWELRTWYTADCEANGPEVLKSGPYPDPTYALYKLALYLADRWRAVDS